MNQIETSRLCLEIELLREQLNRQKNIAGGDALELSLKLDELILEVMKNNGD